MTVESRVPGGDRSTRADSLPAWVRRLVGAILRLYPEDGGGFRREEMAETLFDRCVSEGPAGRRPRFVLREILSLAAFAVRERIRGARDLRPVAGLTDDFRFATKALGRHRAFALGAVIMLALGIGVNTAVFSLVRGEFRIADRFEDPGTLVFLWAGDEGMRVPWEDLQVWRERSSAFRAMGYFGERFRIVTGLDEPFLIRQARTSANLFPMLGLRAEVGRLYGAEDEEPSAPPVAVISHRFWQERYGGTDSVLGRSILLDEIPHTIVGVLPSTVEFQMLWRGASVFAPLVVGEAEAGRVVTLHLDVMARLAEGVTVAAGQAQLTAIAARLAESRPEARNQVRALVQPLRDFLMSPEDRLIWAGVVLAVAAVLLIACVNLANLLLAKGATRQGEVAVRMAMGATRGRVVRQLLSESLVLALLGGVGGILLGRWGLHLVVSSVPSTPYLSEEIGLDPGLLVFTFAVSVVAALAFGLSPALLASRVSLGECLKASGTGSSSGRARKRLRDWMLVGQLALSVPLALTCAVSFLNVRALRTTDFGFPVQGLLSVDVSVPAYRYRDAAQQARLITEIVESVKAIPGVSSAGAGPGIPIGPRWGGLPGPLVVEGREDLAGRARGPFGYYSVTTGYFRTLGARLRSGRVFGDQDVAGSPPVAVVNETFAALYWPAQNPLGKRLMPETDPARVGPTYPFAASGPVTVIGVVANVGAAFHGEAPGPAVYVPQSQFPSTGVTLVVRTSGSPANMGTAIREAVARVDAGVPVTAVQTGEGAVTEWLQESRTVGASLGFLAVLALGMALLGLYGMVAHSVAQRTFELGLRAVLGASPAELRLSVMRSFVALAGVGTVLGVLVSIAIGVVARSVLVLPRISFLPVVLCVTGLMIGAATVAAYLPARRATRIEPVIALKCE